MDAKAYAIHRNVSGAMVTKYLRQGMIPSAKQVGRKWIIDPNKADQELDAALGRNNQKLNPVKINVPSALPLPKYPPNLL